VSTKSILDAFGTKLKEDLQHSIDANIKKNASKHGGDYGGNSRLAASVRFYYTVNAGQSTSFKLAMNDYWVNFNDGRGKGKRQPPTKPIEEWLKKRGVKVELSSRVKKKVRTIGDKAEKKKVRQQSRDAKIKGIAFVIARGIKKNGIKPTHFFDKIIKDGRMEKLKNDLGKDFVNQIVNG
jgi:hypothetical protein